MNKKINILITGGAGFIGSNLVKYFIDDDRFNKIKVLDDLSNGSLSNIEKYLEHPKFEFIKGDIRNYDLCLNSTKGIDVISHQAALGSVPRSIENPILSTEVNITGTVNLLNAAVKNNIKKVILAFSSSTYGDLKTLPKYESKIGNPMSPYAVTKLSIEKFAQVFGKVYDLNWIGLRYFNIFGPNQDPENPYAAVIPIFCKNFIHNQEINVNGIGDISRDFTYIENVLFMNELAIFNKNKLGDNQIYNCACGESYSLNDIIKILKKILK